jgi:hypothetical protein
MKLLSVPLLVLAAGIAFAQDPTPNHYFKKEGISQLMSLGGCLR